MALLFFGLVSTNPIKRNLGMVAYQFYWYDPARGYELVGMLPERRKNPERITQESIMGWAKKTLGDKLSTKDIYIIQVPINEYGEMVFQPAPFKK